MLKKLLHTELQFYFSSIILWFICTHTLIISLKIQPCCISRLVSTPVVVLSFTLVQFQHLSQASARYWPLNDSVTAAVPRGRLVTGMCLRLSEDVLRMTLIDESLFCFILCRRDNASAAPLIPVGFCFCLFNTRFVPFLSLIQLAYQLGSIAPFFTLFLPFTHLLLEHKKQVSFSDQNIRVRYKWQIMQCHEQQTQWSRCGVRPVCVRVCVYKQNCSRLNNRSWHLGD